MKKITLNQMEKIQGGDFLEGACSVFAGTGAGIAVRALVGASFSIPVWGQAVLAAGAVACVGRSWGVW